MSSEYIVANFCTTINGNDCNNTTTTTTNNNNNNSTAIKSDVARIVAMAAEMLYAAKSIVGGLSVTWDAVTSLHIDSVIRGRASLHVP